MGKEGLVGEDLRQFLLPKVTSQQPLALPTGPLLSQHPGGLLDSQQLAQPQSFHLGQAAELPLQTNPLLASLPPRKHELCLPCSSPGMPASLLKHAASPQLA